LESVRLVGINARNLGSLETDLSFQQELGKQAPAGKILIAESGIRSVADIKKLRGFDAVLIGSLFMRAENPTKKVADIISAARGMKS
jgi:indole-3-glycerol phosphate synthase